MNITTEQLFTEARTQNGYLPTAVPDATLHALYELMKWGPTSANCSPARLLFVRSDEAKARLVACVSHGNVLKVRRTLRGVNGLQPPGSRDALTAWMRTIKPSARTIIRCLTVLRRSRSTPSVSATFPKMSIARCIQLPPII